MGDLVRARPQPAKYIDIPILEILIDQIEEKRYDEGATVAAAVGILNHYFPVQDGFVVTSEPVQTEDGTTGDNATSSILVQKFYTESGRLKIFLYGDVKRFEERINKKSRGRLEETVRYTQDWPGWAWMIYVYGPEISFHRMEMSLGGRDCENPYFYAFRCPDRPSRHQFHLRHDADTVHELLKHMAANEPPISERNRKFLADA